MDCLETKAEQVKAEFKIELKNKIQALRQKQDTVRGKAMDQFKIVLSLVHYYQGQLASESGEDPWQRINW